MSDAAITSIRTNAIRHRGKPITYRRKTTQVPNLKTGDVTPDFDDIEIDFALVGPLQNGSQGSVRVFQFLSSELDALPSTADVVLYNDVEYHIQDWLTDQHDIVYAVITFKP